MFNYIHECIINKDDAKNEMKDGVLVLRRVGNFVKTKVVGGNIYKTPAVEGKCDEVALAYAAPAAGNIVRYLIELTTPSKELVEFANPAWKEFGKPIIIESTAASAADFAKTVQLAIAGLPLVVEADGSKITATEDWIRIKGVKQEITPMVCSACDAPGEELVSEADLAVTAGNASFATGEWLQENLRFPSYPNMRYASMNADEAPELGAKYTQYMFKYEVEKAAPGGLCGVNQVIKSETPIVIYVKDGLNAAGLIESLGSVKLDAADLSDHAGTGHD